MGRIMNYYIIFRILSVIRETIHRQSYNCLELEPIKGFVFRPSLDFDTYLNDRVLERVWTFAFCPLDNYALCLKNHSSSNKVTMWFPLPFSRDFFQGVYDLRGFGSEMVKFDGCQFYGVVCDEMCNIMNYW